MSQGKLVSSPVGFSVGICATGKAEDTPSLVENILTDSAPEGLELRKVIVVASQCFENVVSQLKGIQDKQSRVHLISEDFRRGKADAVNKILAKAEGDLIVLVNSDAHPEAGAVRTLLGVLASDPSVGAVSATPVTEGGGGVVSELVDFMWTTHNECSLALNHMNISNHSSDELVAFRSKAIGTLPEGLVNDGAFMAATARRRGYSVKVSTTARVRIETPGRFSDLVSQRRRIIFGHAQVWRKMGNPPKTIESLILFAPSIGFRLIVRTIAHHPKFLLVLPIAIISEFAASFLAAWDGLHSTKRHAVWRRFT